jgi:hypothetical protein
VALHRGAGRFRWHRSVVQVFGCGQGRTLIEFAHRGWPHTDGNFRKCNTQWAILLHHLRDFVETGKAAPALKAPV